MDRAPTRFDSLGKLCVLIIIIFVILFTVTEYFSGDYYYYYYYYISMTFIPCFCFRLILNSRKRPGATRI